MRELWRSEGKQVAQHLKSRDIEIESKFIYFNNLTCILNSSLQSHKSDVMSSVDCPVIEAFMRSNFLDFIDSHWVSAIPAHAVLVQAQVMIAQSDIFPANRKCVEGKSIVIDSHLSAHQQPST